MAQIGPRIPVMPTPLYYLASMADAMQGAPWLSAPASLFDCPCRANDSVHACVRLQALCRHTLDWLDELSLYTHSHIVVLLDPPGARPSSAIALWSLLLPLWERYRRWLDLVTARQHAPTHNTCRSPEWMHMHPTPPHLHLDVRPPKLPISPPLHPLLFPAGPRPASAIALWSLLLPLWERYRRWLDLVTARCGLLGARVAAARQLAEPSMRGPANAALLPHLRNKGLLLFRGHVLLAYGLRRPLQVCVSQCRGGGSVVHPGCITLGLVDLGSVGVGGAGGGGGRHG